MTKDGEVDVVRSDADCLLMLRSLIVERKRSEKNNNFGRVGFIDWQIDNLKQEIKDRGIERCAFSVTG